MQFTYLISQKYRNAERLPRALQLIISLMGLVVLLLGPVPAANAEGPEVGRDSWHGHIRSETPTVERTFSPPEGATSVEAIMNWQWTGEPDQKQLNEGHEVQMPNGQTVVCPDFGDEELEGQWLECGRQTIDWADPLLLQVSFAGDASSPGSHFFRVDLVWYANYAPVCRGITNSKQAIAPTGEMITVQIDSEHATNYRIIRLNDGTVMTQGDQPILSFLAEPNVIYQAQVGNASHLLTTEGCTFSYSTHQPICQSVDLSLSTAEPIPAAGTVINIRVIAANASQFRLIGQETDGRFSPTKIQNEPVFNNIPVLPDIAYRVEVSNGANEWISSEACDFQYNTGLVQPPDLSCQLTTLEPERSYLPGAADENNQPASIEAWRATSNFDFNVSETDDVSKPAVINFPDEPGRYLVQFEVKADETWLAGSQCQVNKEVEKPCDCGQYQDFIGAVPFGTFTPDLEAGKEYFDGARSMMYNVEYLTPDGQGEVVYRFNGQEVDDVTSSLFFNNQFARLNSQNGRANHTFETGVTKLIAYRYGAEKDRIFQTVAADQTRWIHPLDQPFEFKPDFSLELNGPAGTTDLLRYNDQELTIQYDSYGQTQVELSYDLPGLIAIYPQIEQWQTVDQIRFTKTMTQARYVFTETGLYHYRLVAPDGRIVAGPAANSQLSFVAEAGQTYRAQVIYPATSLFVGLYDDMKFQPTTHWTVPIDAQAEHDHEFHLDYHRQGGQVVVDALTLLNATTSVAQQFPYGRHDNALPGVKIVGIPTASMVAFCQRPGMHEVAYWGGWENESYYLPDRSWVYDDEQYALWSDDQRRDCVDAALRVNMELARQGLRTDHTFRHHGQLSQGYQLSQAHAWSPFNLVGLRPPHLGQILKPGKALSYYHTPEETLFWGWDLATGGLQDGLDTTTLSQYLADLGPVEYIDQTGIHSSSS